ncbi:hypothetical protein TNCV_2925151 [Trichonephila clavipes]|nr:hypothetical protein TNCV_2925151 [Trichonephila clavipes]
MLKIKNLLVYGRCLNLQPCVRYRYLSRPKFTEAPSSLNDYTCGGHLELLPRLQIFFLLAFPSMVQTFENRLELGLDNMVDVPELRILTSLFFRPSIGQIIAEALSCNRMTPFRSFPQSLDLVKCIGLVRTIHSFPFSVKLTASILSMSLNSDSIILPADD